MKRTPKSLKDFELVKSTKEILGKKKPIKSALEVEIEIEHKPMRGRPKKTEKKSCFSEGGATSKGDWIEKAIKKPGALRKELHVKKGEKIPEKKLDKAMHSDDALLRKRARLAKTLKSFKK